MNKFEGVLVVNKPSGKTSFSLVAALRRILGVKKIGHAGTLDPFATGVMVLLIGRTFTRLSNQFLAADKEYEATVRLGVTTDTYDCKGMITSESDLIPTQDAIEAAIERFQGEIEQIPPMYSAKKVNGQKLYELARKGRMIERRASRVTVKIELKRYHYPFLDLNVECSKGTYIRSLAHDIGSTLGCGAHLESLQRKRSGVFHLNSCLDGSLLFKDDADPDTISSHIKQINCC